MLDVIHLPADMSCRTSFSGDLPLHKLSEKPNPACKNCRAQFRWHVRPRLRLPETARDSLLSFLVFRLPRFGFVWDALLFLFRLEALALVLCFLLLLFREIRPELFGHFRLLCELGFVEEWLLLLEVSAVGGEALLADC